jgi:hypothetical protein
MRDDQATTNAHMAPGGVYGPVTAIALDDGIALALVLDDEGEAWPWVVLYGSDGEPPGCSCRCCAPHEQGGRLRGDHAEAVGLTCGAPTVSGRPCRNLVQRGERCDVHQGEGGI